MNMTWYLLPLALSCQHDIRPCLLSLALASDNSSHTRLGHGVFVESEGDVSAAAVWVTPGCGWGTAGGAPALPLARAGLGEAARVLDGYACLAGGTLRGSSVPMEAAGRRTTVKLPKGKVFVFLLLIDSESKQRNKTGNTNGTVSGTLVQLILPL